MLDTRLPGHPDIMTSVVRHLLRYRRRRLDPRAR